jgi:hypothetical protein
MDLVVRIDSSAGTINREVSVKSQAKLRCSGAK